MIDLKLLAIVKYLEYMQSIKESDKGQKFFLDNDKSEEVEVFEVMGDDWVKIIKSDGSHMTVVPNRLRKVELEQVKDDVVSLEYPVKPTKVTIELLDEATGKVSVRWLEGEDAVKWNAWMRELCYKAEELGVNPEWLTLEWKHK